MGERSTSWVAAAVVLLALAGCAVPDGPSHRVPGADPSGPSTSRTPPSPPSTPPPSPPTLAITTPPLGAGVDYQLGGAYPPPDGVRIVVRDPSDPPAGLGYDICYVNAFQTQPDESAAWLTDHPDLVLHDPDGRPVIDPDWPDEYLLDTSTAKNRERIVDLMAPQLDACAARGFHAVEFDNLDSFDRSAGHLELDDNLALAETLIAHAHDVGLAAGQKNLAELGTRGPDLGFDFVVAEDCAIWDECEDYLAAYGRHVIEIEYDDSDDLTRSMDHACTTRGRGPESISIVGRDRALATPEDEGYVFVTC